jgi:hypothetical protein
MVLENILKPPGLDASSMSCETSCKKKNSDNHVPSELFCLDTDPQPQSTSARSLQLDAKSTHQRGEISKNRIEGVAALR